MEMGFMVALIYVSASLKQRSFPRTIYPAAEFIVKNILKGGIDTCQNTEISFGASP
jgi:hypothetical protein